MIGAYCPSHITCFFQPVESTDILSKGSRGAGIRINPGTEVHISENRSPKTDIVMDGTLSDAPLTRKVLETALPGRGFDVTVINGLPVGQGFGTSAAGVIATALCAGEISGTDRQKCFELAHTVEIMMGGGLGDVSALMSESLQPVRAAPGIPPIGNVIGTGVELGKMSVAILGPKMATSSVLNNGRKYEKISEAGRVAVDEYLKYPSKKALFDISNRFSEDTGLQSEDVASAMERLSDYGVRSGMCMLGNSIFADTSSEVLLRLLGDVDAYDIIPTDRPAGIIRKA